MRIPPAALFFPPSGLLGEMKDFKRLVLGEFDSREAGQARRRCNEAGLQFEGNAVQHRGPFLFN